MSQKLGMLSTEKEISDFFGHEPLMAASVRVTKGCNLRCRHCYANGGVVLDKEMKTEEVKKVIDQLAKLGVLHIFFTGGEPFIRRDMVEILEYTDKKDLGILLSTNAQLVTKEILEKIKKLNIKLFQVSLDGLEATHDLNRGQGVYKNAVKIVKEASKILGKNVTVGTVMMKNNWKNMDKIMAEAVKNGADVFSLMLLILSGRASTQLAPSPKETMTSLKKLFEEYGKQGRKIKFATNSTIPPALVPKKWRLLGLHEKFAFCSFPYCLGIEANGDVAPCDGFFNFKEMLLGNIRDISLEEIWDKSQVLKDLRAINPQDLKGVCKICIYRDYCAGGCRASAYNVFHDMTMPDPICQSIYEAGLFPKDCLIKDEASKNRKAN